MATDVAKKEEEERVIEDILRFINPGDYYISIEKALKDEKEDDKLAISLGFRPDNYYTAKQKMDMQNDLDRGLFEARAPISRTATFRTS